MPRKGELKQGVERYENGRIKYDQDSKAQWEKYKGKYIMITTKMPPDIANQFDAKLEAEGSNRSAKIKGWISDYLEGKLK